jgi:hypothetical protein
MRRNFFFSSAVLANLAVSLLAAVSLLSIIATARPPQAAPAQTFRFAQPSASAGGCEIYYSIQPVDPNLLKLLGTPAVPTNPSLLTSPEYPTAQLGFALQGHSLASARSRKKLRVADRN